MRSVTYLEWDVPEFDDSASPVGTETYRFAKPTDYLPDDIEAIPSISEVSYTPARISLGKNLGERAALDVTFRDHPHILNGEPYEQGSFFGKWRGRYGTRLTGSDLRWLQGFLGDDLGDMVARHFVVEKTEGPTLDGAYQVTAKDPLKLADDDRAQAPAISSGFLTSDITDTDTSAQLSPAGVGDDEYPASGFVAIGGEEICAFTRSGDTLTLTRGELGTEAASHDSGDRVQLVLRYTGADPADIIADLLETYANVPSSYIPIEDWRTETDSYLQRLYTATIPDPVSVHKLLKELVEQAALAIWWSPEAQQLRLQVLRKIPTDADTFTPDNVIEGSLKPREQPDTRLSQIITYFGQRNPLRPIDEVDNFRSVAALADLEAQADYGRAAIKKIYSRWIPFGGRAVADRVNQIQLARYKDPPRRFAFSVWRNGEIVPVLGGGYRLEAWPIQDKTGAASDAAIQITRLRPGEARIELEAEEALFQADPVDLINRVITIDADSRDVNLRTLHDQIYPAPTGGESPPINVTAVIDGNVVVGATDTDTPAFDTGDWPGGIPIDVRVRGRIQGRGGDGADAASFARRGEDGGTALKVRVPIDLLLDEGDAELWGGGGGGSTPNDVQGGGTGGGGGGAGDLPGLGGSGFQGTGEDGEDGTREAGGEGGNGRRAGGDGGDPGQPGTEGTSGSFTTDPGAAIDGVSNVTKTGTGDIRGSEIN